MKMGALYNVFSKVPLLFWRREIGEKPPPPKYEKVWSGILLHKYSSGMLEFIAFNRFHVIFEERKTRLNMIEEGNIEIAHKKESHCDFKNNKSIYPMYRLKLSKIKTDNFIEKLYDIYTNKLEIYENNPKPWQLDLPYEIAKQRIYYGSIIDKLYKLKNKKEN